MTMSRYETDEAKEKRDSREVFVRIKAKIRDILKENER
jgi:hypothetical protein